MKFETVYKKQTKTSLVDDIALLISIKDINNNDEKVEEMIKNIINNLINVVSYMKKPVIPSEHAKNVKIFIKYKLQLFGKGSHRRKLTQDEKKQIKRLVEIEKNKKTIIVTKIN